MYTKRGSGNIKLAHQRNFPRKQEGKKNKNKNKKKGGENVPGMLNLGHYGLDIRSCRRGKSGKSQQSDFHITMQAHGVDSPMMGARMGERKSFAA